MCEGVNPLTTNDAFWSRQSLATCYQLAQSILKIGSALGGEGGRSVLWSEGPDN